jgi:hypothetical protein
MTGEQWAEINKSDIELIKKFIGNIEDGLPLLTGRDGQAFLQPIKNMLLEAWIDLEKFKEDGIRPFGELPPLSDIKGNQVN